MLDNIHMDGRESNEDMNKNRDHWFSKVNRSYQLQVMTHIRWHWSGLDEETRKDIFNKSLEKLLNRLSQGAVDPGMAWVPGFLKKTAYNLCRSEFRKLTSMKARFGKRVPFEGNAEGSVGGGDIAAFDLYFEEEREQGQAQMWEWRHDALEYGLSCLSEKERRLILMRHLEHKSMTEIAEVLEYASARSAAKAKCLALGRLREHALAASAAFTGLAA